MTDLQNWKRRLTFWLGALAVGAIAVLFALASTAAHSFFQQIIAVSPYLPLIVTPIGFATAVFLTRRVFPGSQGSGIPQTIAALEAGDHASRGAMLSLRIAVGKIMLTLWGLLCGASIGREGPTVQIGASIMHSLSRLADFPRHDLDKGLILAGGAAGIAAAFNTPLAGVVFAIEEMSRSFEQRTSGTILIAVIMAGMVPLAFLGNYSYFGHTSVALNLGKEWFAVIVCGIVGGALGGVFSRILVLASQGLPGWIGSFMRERPAMFAALCGVFLAGIGIISGNTIYGTGYDEAKQVIEGVQTSESYGLLKMLATIISYLSGIPGGIFAPSLSAGAGIGAMIAKIMPGAPLGSVVILGMVAYFSGVVQSPITAFVIVMEMTDNHGMILPLMAASFIAYAISKLICPVPLYQALAKPFLNRQDTIDSNNDQAPRSPNSV